MIKINLTKVMIYSTLVITFVIAIYIFNFFSHPISKETSDWGSFADYFGGILNPLIGIANLLVFIYLTFQVSKIENERQASNVKMEVYKDIQKILNNFTKELSEWKEGSDMRITNICDEFNFLATSYSFTFKVFENNIHKDLLESMIKLQQAKDNINRIGVKAFGDDLTIFFNKRNKFILEVRKELAKNT